jgi:hypothetical protein
LKIMDSDYLNRKRLQPNTIYVLSIIIKGEL